MSARSKSRSKKFWAISVAALVAANVVDACVSQGRYETNPLLRNPNGTFSSTRGLLVKSGTSAAAISVELLLFRGGAEPDLYTTSAALNLTSAAALTALAVRNSHVPRAAAGLPPLR